MARKVAPGTLIHCDTCGEDYSSTYKRCPFCGERPDKGTTGHIPSAVDQDDDDYVFDGSDVFEDDQDAPDERPARPRGGKRLAQDSAPGPINWPRVITFICSLIIIAAALVIVFAYIYPKIHNSNPNPSQNPSPGVSSPVVESQSPSQEPSADPSGEPSAEPSGEPSAPPSESPSGSVTGLSLSNVDFTLKPNESYAIKATVSPTSWGGTVTWSSSNSSVATVTAGGIVTNVNSGSSLRSVTITATAGNMTATAKVYCTGGSSGGAAPSSEPSSGVLTLNREDFTLVLSQSQTFTLRASGADSVTWSIGNTAVATIGANGLVTPVGAGTTTVTATAPDGQTATCTVRVRN